jgi:cytochrome c1
MRSDLRAYDVRSDTVKHALQVVSALAIILLGAAVFARGYRSDHTTTRTGPESSTPEPRDGAAARGRMLIAKHNCGSCHTIPGVAGATGTVAAPLSRFAQRTFVAGVIPNTQENLAMWIENPQNVDPKTAMPNLGLSPVESLEIAAYLESLQ